MTEFKTSSFCSWGACVEVGMTPGGPVVLRRTNDVDHTLTFTRDEWEAFVKGVKSGEFDHG